MFNKQKRNATDFRIQNEYTTENFSFGPLTNPDDEGKWLLAVPSFKTTDSVFNQTHEKHLFSNIAPGHWSTENTEETINILNNLLSLRSENDLDLHIKEVNRRVKTIFLDGQEYTYYNLLDKFKYDFTEMLKKNKYDDLKDMVYRLELTKNEIIDILDLKYIPLSTTGCTLPSGLYEIRDIDVMLQSLLPSDVELKNFQLMIRD